MDIYKRILIGIDGSKESYDALDKAIQIAKNNDAKLYVAHIIDVRALQSYSTMSIDVADNARADAREEMEKVTKYVEQQEFYNMETLLEYGSPRTQMAMTIPEEKDIDLIVVGATGLNAMERILIGSVSEYIVRNAACDVLVARADVE